MKKIITILALVAVAAIWFGVGWEVKAKTSSSSALCYTFPNRSYPQGLMQEIQGKVCTTSAPIQAIAKNYNQCVPAESADQCGYELMSYLASSSATPEDNAKVTLLVLTAARGQ